ncbi:MAG: site-2 protease family protein [Candidatus Calescibacterium sp.]|nr:PDZ domain-containing protein [Candidatus Calescibacterium sp.]MDW8133330.1 site-2 protease family protein [Candidatus Calescibacterium sp.]
MKEQIFIIIFLFIIISKTFAQIIVDKIMPNSIAEQVGIKEGDIITEINDKKVDKIEIFIRILKLSQKNQEIVTIKLIRKNEIKQMIIDFSKFTDINQPLGVILKYHEENNQKEDPFNNYSSDEYYIKIATEKINYQKQTFRDINILKGVLFFNNKVFFFGHYNPDYTTGPINYHNLLGEALKYPNPLLSIDPVNKNEMTEKLELRNETEDPKNAFKTITKIIIDSFKTNNPKTVSIINSNLKKHNLTKEDVEKYIDYQINEFDLSTKEKIYDLFNSLYKLYSAGFEAEGYDPQIGIGICFLWLFNKTSDTTHLIQAIQVLGIEEEYNNLKNQYLQKGNLTEKEYSQFSKRLLEMLYRKILEGLKTSQEQIESLINDAYQNSIDKNYLDDTKIVKFVNEKELKIMKEFFYSIIEFLPIQNPENYFQIPTIYMTTRIENLSRDTEIFKILFLSDLGIKSLKMNTQFQDFFEFAYHKKSLEKLSDRGFLMFTIKPQKIESYVINKNFLIIGDSQIRIEVTPDYQATQVEWELIKEYQYYLNQNVELMRKEIPYIHRLIELQKVLFLANYIEKNGINIDLYSNNINKFEVPEKIKRTPTGLISSPKELDKAILLISWGGIDFSNIENSFNISHKPVENVKESLINALVLSEMAVNEAINGNLEKSRYLAELSFQSAINNVELPEKITTKIKSEKIEIKNTNKIPEIIAFSFETINQLENIQKQISNESKNLDNKPSHVDSLKKINILIKTYKDEYLNSDKNFDFSNFETIYIHNTEEDKKQPHTIDNLQIKNDFKNLKREVEQEIDTFLKSPNQNNKNRIQQIEQNISSMEQDLQKAKQNLDKVNKELLYNVKKYEEWVEEAEKYRKNIYNNSYNTLLNLVLDKALDLSKKLFPEYEKQIELIKFTKNYSEFNYWFYEISKNPENINIETIYQGLQKAINNLPDTIIGEKIKNFLSLLDYSLQTSFDSYNLYISFQQYKNYEKIVEMYILASEKQRKYIQKLEENIKKQRETLQKLKN